MRPPALFADRRIVAALATLCCVLWGSAVPAVKVGYELFAIVATDLGSLLLFAGVRFSLAGLLLLAFAVASRRSLRLGRRGFAQVALLGLVQTAVQYWFFYVGVANTTAVNVAITTSTSSFFGVLLAHFIYADDKLTLRRALGCLAGFLGVVAVNLSAGGLELHFAVLGEGAIMLAAFIISGATIYGKRLSRHMDATVMTGWQLLIGGLLLAAAGLIGGGRLAGAGFGAGEIALIGYLAALSAVAFAVWSVLFKYNPVSAVAPYQFLIPVFGVLLAGLVLGENIFAWKNLAALLLVTLGIWLVTTRGRPPVVTPA